MTVSGFFSGLDSTMESVLRYFFFEVLLSAGPPVFAAYIANWAVVNRFRIYDYLGDGQLCFYATTLSVVTTSGLFASKTASLTVKISAGGTMLWVVILANVVWALADSSLSLISVFQRSYFLQLLLNPNFGVGMRADKTH